MKKYSVCIIILLCFSIHLTGQKVSVKERWNIKASYSLYKTINLNYDPLFIIEGSKLFGEARYEKRSNPRIEVNYGVLNWLEVGVYAGFMIYRYLPFISTEEGILVKWGDTKDAYIPTFGVNANVHLLPFFVKNQKCHWDFYIPLRYGGCYLTKFGEGKYALPMYDLDTWDTVKKDVLERRYNFDKKYRHEYGAGLGGAIYIKNIIGFYAEVLGGQFSYWPEMIISPYAIRFGLTAKF
ncbi:MAG: hypothetical protein LBN95_04135 [Prevotellaceae bacterium]|jgi:hypothetical protein|nr:hypothetical protein [Prevotellaceae bacterium]